MRLKVIDIEDQITRICGFSDAKTWNWSNPAPLGLIDGRQVNSLECLIEILNDKAEKGYQEVKICEAPVSCFSPVAKNTRIGKPTYFSYYLISYH